MEVGDQSPASSIQFWPWGHCMHTHTISCLCSRLMGCFIYLFESQSNREEETEEKKSFPQWPQQSGPDLAEVRSPELHLSLLCRWQEPKYLRHLLLLSLACWHAAVREVEQPGFYLELVSQCRLNLLHDNTVLTRFLFCNSFICI